MSPHDPRSPAEQFSDDFMAEELAKRLKDIDYRKLGFTSEQQKILENIPPATGVIVHPESSDLQAIWAELKRLSGVCDTLITRSRTASQNDADLLRTAMRLENELQDVRDRLARLGASDKPRPQGYSRSGPTPDWQDGTRTHPKGEDDDAYNERQAT